MMLPANGYPSAVEASPAHSIFPEVPIRLIGIESDKFW
jgi:hypothetical protein